jgi:hypothetical protein
MNTLPIYPEILGRTAYSNGCPCSPALDPNMTELLRGREVGDPKTAASLKAWIQGWVREQNAEIGGPFPIAR